MEKNLYLKNKTAIITGGTGGIGEKICEIFADRGANIAFTYHNNEEKARLLKDKLSKKENKIIFSRVSALNGHEIEKFVDHVWNTFGQIDILVNNVGIAQIMPFALIEEEDWDLVMDVNVKGTFLMSKAVARYMIRQKSGNIINFSSIAGQRLIEVPVHYAASKAAIIGFTISLAKELCRYNIRVNTITPGLIDVGVGMNLSQKQREEYTKYCSLGRAGKPEEVAEVAAFLASEYSSYINAQSITIDGGL